ncbi:formate acetyltransferase [Streptomyces badius]
MTATVTTAPRTADAWRQFTGSGWRERIDVRDFIQANYTPYEGDSGFLTGATGRTRAVWEKVSALFPEERRKGVLDVDTATPSTITSHAPGWIDRDRELIVGLQTDAPLKRAIMPNGGLRMVENGLKAYGYEPDPFVTRVFDTYRKTHNAGVFDAYTPAMRAARRVGIITGLPDAYGRGRIIGDYRRVALYGTDRLIEAKNAERAGLDGRPSTADIIRDREELAEQIRALGELTEMAATYGCDVSRPAATAHEAVQLALPRLPGRREGAERRGDVARPDLHLPGRLPPARPGRRTPRRDTSPGTDRRLRHQAPHRPLPAHPRVRRAVLRRPPG